MAARQGLLRLQKTVVVELALHSVWSAQVSLALLARKKEVVWVLLLAMLEQHLVTLSEVVGVE